MSVGSRRSRPSPAGPCNAPSQTSCSFRSGDQGRSSRPSTTRPSVSTHAESSATAPAVRSCQNSEKRGWSGTPSPAATSTASAYDGWYARSVGAPAAASSSRCQASV